MLFEEKVTVFTFQGSSLWLKCFFFLPLENAVIDKIVSPAVTSRDLLFAVHVFSG